jgi:hypothetical protein
MRISDIRIRQLSIIATGQYSLLSHWRSRVLRSDHESMSANIRVNLAIDLGHVTSASLTKGLDTPELKTTQSLYCDEKTRKQTQLVYRKASCCC